MEQDINSFHRRAVSRLRCYEVASTGAKVIFTDAEKFLENLCESLANGPRHKLKFNISRHKSGYICRGG